MKLYSSKEISSFKKNIFIQGNYIHSRIYSFKNTYSFKFKANTVHSRKLYSSKQRCVRGHSRNIYSKIVPRHFMIIIGFTVSISWIKYSYNSFRLKVKKLLIWSMVSYYNHCPCRFCYHRAKKYHSNHCPLPTLYLRQNLICPPESRLCLNKLLSILQTVSSSSRYIILFLFGRSFHRQNLPQRSPLFTPLTTSDRVSPLCGRLGKLTSVWEPIYKQL